MLVFRQLNFEVFCVLIVLLVNFFETFEDSFSSNSVSLDCVNLSAVLRNELSDSASFKQSWSSLPNCIICSSFSLRFISNSIQNFLNSMSAFFLSFSCHSSVFLCYLILFFFSLVSLFSNESICQIYPLHLLFEMYCRFSFSVCHGSQDLRQQPGEDSPLELLQP